MWRRRSITTEGVDPTPKHWIKPHSDIIELLVHVVRQYLALRVGSMRSLTSRVSMIGLFCIRFPDFSFVISKRFFISYMFADLNFSVVLARTMPSSLVAPHHLNSTTLSIDIGNTFHF